MYNLKVICYRACLREDNEDYKKLIDELSTNQYDLLTENSKINMKTNHSMKQANYMYLYLTYKNYILEKTELFKDMEELKQKYQYDKMIDLLNKIMNEYKQILINDDYDINNEIFIEHLLQAEKYIDDYSFLSDEIDLCEFPDDNYEKYFRASLYKPVFNEYLTKKFYVSDL